MKILKKWFEYSTRELYEMLNYFEKMNNQSKVELVMEQVNNRNGGMLGYYTWKASIETDIRG